jgi:hypothetical protein
MESGQIEEIGTHAELLELGGSYARLWAAFAGSSELVAWAALQGRDIRMSELVGPIRSWGSGWSGSAGLEPNRTNVVAGGQPHVGVQGRSQAPEQGDRRLGTAFLNALDLVADHARSPREGGDAQPQRDAPVIQGLAKRQGLADRDPLGIIGQILRTRPASVIASHHICSHKKPRLWPDQGRRALYMVGAAAVSAHGQEVMPAMTYVDATTRPQVLASSASLPG